MNLLTIIAILFVLYLLFGASQDTIEGYYPWWRRRLPWWRRRWNRWWMWGPNYYRYSYYPYYSYY